MQFPQRRKGAKKATKISMENKPLRLCAFAGKTSRR
jgi:hypothetical protein